MIPRSGRPPSGRSLLGRALSSPVDILLSIVALAVVASLALLLLEWAVFDAVWTGRSGGDCAGRSGACWIFISDRLGQILYGGYPAGERWRVDITFGIGALALVAGLFAGRYLGPRGGVALLVGYAALGALLLRGGVLGLEPVPTTVWGGLMLTLVIAAWTIATAVPLGLLLALARRSSMPVISVLAAIFIDVVRGLPLVGILFLAIVLFPLFAPPGVETDKLARAILAFTLFNAANLAEVFRGGLQSVPPGQKEAGASLGLKGWMVTWLLVVPQAFAISLPGVVNICIAVVKETTIVLIVGLFDFLGVLQAGLSDPDWLAAEQARNTAYFFAAIVFWAICFSLSRYSLYLERRLKGAPAG